MVVVGADRWSWEVVLKIRSPVYMVGVCKSGRSSQKGFEGCDDDPTVYKAAGLSGGRTRWCLGEEETVIAGRFREGCFWRW